MHLYLSRHRSHSDHLKRLVCLPNCHCTTYIQQHRSWYQVEVFCLGIAEDQNWQKALNHLLSAGNGHAYPFFCNHFGSHELLSLGSLVTHRPQREGNSLLGESSHELNQSTGNAKTRRKPRKTLELPLLTTNI